MMQQFWKYICIVFVVALQTFQALCNSPFSRAVNSRCIVEALPCDASALLQQGDTRWCISCRTNSAGLQVGWCWAHLQGHCWQDWQLPKSRPNQFQRLCNQTRVFSSHCFLKVSQQTKCFCVCTQASVCGCYTNVQTNLRRISMLCRPQHPGSNMLPTNTCFVLFWRAATCFLNDCENQICSLSTNALHHDSASNVGLFLLPQYVTLMYSVLMFSQGLCYLFVASMSKVN